MAAYSLTIYYAFWKSYLALLGAIFLPGLVQIYWIWMTWSETGVFFSPLTFFCIESVVLGALAVLLELRDGSARKSSQASGQSLPYRVGVEPAEWEAGEAGLRR